MKNRFFTVSLLLLLTFLFAGISVSSTTELRGRNASDKAVSGKIDEAYREGEIDYETALTYKVYAIKDYKKLPEKFQSDKPSWCGTLNLLEAWRNLVRVSKETNQILSSYLSRPTFSGPESVIPTTHFKIHYTTSGRDAVTFGYAENISNYAEQSWNKEVDNMGWDAPPPDGVDGDEYDIYIVSSGGAGWVGYCQPESPGPDPDQEDYTSYFVVASGLGSDLAKVTVAHEFNHACQFSYSGSEASFWYENCAVWMEDMVYDKVNDYYYYITTGWQNPIYWPDVSITTFNGEYEYGASTWVFYLTERHNDNDMPRRIWARNGIISGNNTISDIDYILSNYYGSSFNAALKEYSVWRYFSGSNDDGQHFSEGSHWVDPYVEPAHIHDTYPAQGTQGNRPPDRYGTNFIQSNSPGGQGDFDITFDGQDGKAWAAMIAHYPGTAFTEFGLDGNSAGSISVSWGNSSRIILVPVVMSSSGSNLTYAYSAAQGADETPPTMEQIVEPQGQWYNTAPSFSNFGFDDNVKLDDGWYQVNSCTGSWTILFTNVGGFSWNEDGWTMPGFDDLHQGSNTIYFKADDDANHVGGGCNWSWQFHKDTQPPGYPMNLMSPSHDVEVWSMDPTIEVQWTDAIDPSPGTGLDGYSFVWNTVPSVSPDYLKDIEEGVEATTSPILNDGGNHYFHIQSRDNVGNWQSSIYLGPFWVDRTGPTEGTISINNGDDTTKTSLVTLNDLEAFDVTSGMGPGAEMRFSNDGISWSEPEDYANLKLDWDLNAEEYGGNLLDGEKTVYVRFRDVAGNWSTTFQDDIYFHPPLSILSESLPAGFVGFPYSEILHAVGGSPSYEWSIHSGSLPNGLSLDGLSGVISGTPTVAEIFEFTIEVTDAEPTTITRDLSIVIHTGSKGDVYVDGEVNVIDALVVVNILLKRMIPNEYEYWAADCNGDDTVSIGDVLGIVNTSLGLGICSPATGALKLKAKTD